MISLNIEKTFGFISKEKVFAYEAEVKAAQEMLEKGTGKGNDFLGWLHLPSSITKEHLADLNATAKVLRDNCEVVIVAGIGGSYLGIAKDVMRLPAVGIKKINGEYQRVTLDTRNYNERMNLAPIPQDEVNNCPNIYQNPGY